MFFSFFHLFSIIRYPLSGFDLQSSFSIIDTSENKGGKIVVFEKIAIAGEGEYSDIIIGTGVTINGGGINLTTSNQTLTVYGTIIGGTSRAISTNGSRGNENETINIEAGAKITSANIAIYFPSAGNLNIKGGVIEGADALYIKSGKTTINGGTLKGNGDKADYLYTGNGAHPTGDGIVVENANYPGGNPTVIINGGTITTTNNKGIGYYKKDNSLENPIVKSYLNTFTLTDGWSWEQDSNSSMYTPKGVTVTFKNGEEVKIKTIASGSTVNIPTPEPTKEGYTFTGRSKIITNEESEEETSTPFDFNTPITEDITLIAQWEPNDVKMTFAIDGNNTVLTGKVGASYTKPTPTKSCYSLSWNPTLPDVMPTTDTTYTAKWTYTCRSSGGGSSSKSTTKTEEPKVDDTKADTTTNEEIELKGEVTTTESNENTSEEISTPDNEFSKEFNDAYNFAFKNGITTMPSIEEADMNAPLTRIAMAKMLSQYAINVLGKTADTSKVVPTFPDVSEQLNKDYNDGVTLAYQLGIMGINIEKFRPFDLVTRAEFGTALSRMLYSLSDGEGDEWYKTHLDKLMTEEIITVDTPNLQELRGYVMIMLMRSASN